ncbi:MAG: MATE family efflux transporter [Desulfonatronovibrio sp.]
MDTLSSSYKAIWKLAWPQILMMLFHFLIGFVDVWVAGRLGRDVQASMGIITQSLFFFLVVAIALANGSVAAISQSFGAGLLRRVQRYIGLGLEIGVILGIIFLILGMLFRDSFLGLLHIPDEIMPVAAYLLKVYLYVLPGYYLLIICNAFFRAQRKVMIPLFSMMIVTAANTFGNFAFGLGWWGFPEFGYKGLAWSTFASILCGMFFCLIVLYKQGLLKKKSFAPWCWIKKAFPYLFKVAWPAGLLQVVWHSAYMVLYAITAALPVGSVIALAGMSAGIRVESLLFLPGFAFNFTASILVGNYLGQGDVKSAKRMGYLVMLFGLGLVSTFTLVLWLFIEPVAVFIAPDPEVSVEAINYLKYNMAAIPFLLVSMILGGALTGAGATFYQMIVMGSSAWLVRIPLAWYLGHVHMREATGIWLAMFISMVVQAILMLYFYQMKDWTKFSQRKGRKIVQPNQTINKLKAGK